MTYIMVQYKKEDNSKKLLARIKKMMSKNEMRWKDAANVFGFESPSTVHNWFLKQEIPLNRQQQINLMLENMKF